MKRFLIVCFLGFLGALLLFWGVPILRIALAQPRLDAQFTLPPGTEVLCIGDSRVGCTFVDDPALRNWVLWTSSISYRVRLGFLKNLRRLGQLRPGMTVVSEIGPHEIAHYSDTDWQRHVWGKALSVNWRYPRYWPAPSLLVDYLSVTLPHQKEFFVTLEKVTEDAPPLTERDAHERQTHTQEMLADHYDPAAYTTYAERTLRRDLLDLKRFCADNRLRLILFTAPLDSWYRAQAPEWGKAVFARLQGWLRTEGFDYHDCSDTMEDFWMRDSVHLRLSGAKRFTAWFFARHVSQDGTSRAQADR